jgi:methylmalonyl-CoA carboxyltransferase small subunit
VKLKITIDQKIYEVDVEPVEQENPNLPPRGYVTEPAAVRVPASPVPAPRPAAAEPVNEEKVCRSPVTGTVVRVMAQVGQTLQTGDVLLVLEAMKMETNITAPVGGKVSAMRVNVGDSVQSGQVLVEFE